MSMLGKDILHHFTDERVIGNVDVAGGEIFGACLLLWNTAANKSSARIR